MKKIILFCGAGMSSSLLMTKMRKAAKEANLNCEINAYSLYYADERKVEGDCILIAPQVRYAIDRVKKIYSDTPCDLIDQKAYGLMDGKKVLAQAVKLIKNNQK